MGQVHLGFTRECALSEQYWVRACLSAFAPLAFADIESLVLPIQAVAWGEPANPNV